MSRKQKRPIRKKEPTAPKALGAEQPTRPRSGVSPSPGAGARRASDRQPRRRARQMLAAGAVALALIIVVALVAATQLAQQQGAPSLQPDRHAKGSPQAPVTITEWSDFI